MTEAELLAQPADAYMNEAQQAFFRTLLLGQRAELQARIAEEFQALREQEPSSDPSDIGTAEEQRHWKLRLLEGVKKMLEKSDFVGDRFPDEARAIHLGDAEARAIHGRATPADAKSLADEGIPVAPLIFPVAEPGEEN